MKELPKKWAIQTENEEFYKWANIYHRKEREPILEYGGEGTYSIFPAVHEVFTCENVLRLPEGYELITFERWASVHRPDLVNTPEIPERWCVRRTQENAEILNAWLEHKWALNKVDYPDIRFVVFVCSDWFDGTFCSFGSEMKDGYPEITFDRWQTIPEVAEWLNTVYYKNFDGSLYLKAGCPKNKVDKGEIIGYEAPCNLFGKRIKAGTVFTKCAITSVSFEYIHGQTILPCEIVETWKPVYAEKPVFKVGDWVKVVDPKNQFFGDVLKVESIQKSGRYECSGLDCFEYYQIEMATPEEIEAALPKRKYMKQVWRVLSSDEKVAKSEHIFDTEKEGNDWILENSIEGRFYSCRPVQVVAYE